jgi:hypothetical protein
VQTHYLGLDLAQAGQFTACAVLERPDSEEPQPTYALRYLQRFTLGTPFKAIVEDVSQLVAKLPWEDNYPTLVVDQTGVGRPVLELFRQTGMRARIIPVCITAGQQATIHEDGARLVPKIELVSSLQVLLQNRRVRVARGLSAVSMLTRELQNFRMKVPLTNSNDLAAWREGQHDDLVFAVALACWMAEREPPWGPIEAPVRESLMDQMPPGTLMDGWPPDW